MQILASFANQLNLFQPNTFLQIPVFLLSKAPCSFVTSLLFTKRYAKAENYFDAYLLSSKYTITIYYFYFLSAPKGMRDIVVQSRLEFLAHLLLLVVVMNSDVSVFDECSSRLVIK